MPKYRLKSAFWNGEKLYPKGAEVDFPKGKAPKSAELVKKAAGEEVEPASEPDPDQIKLDL